MLSWLFGDEHRANLALEKALARAYARIDELKLENVRLEAQLAAKEAELERLRRDAVEWAREQR